MNCRTFVSAVAWAILTNLAFCAEELQSRGLIGATLLPVRALFVMGPYFNERHEYQRAYNFTTGFSNNRDMGVQAADK